MELGPIQKQWVADLKAYPERQIDGQLGKRDKEGNLCLCCLGQAIITKCNLQNVEPVFINSNLRECKEAGELEENILNLTYEEYGLNCSEGRLKQKWLVYDYTNYTTLVEANDSGVPWAVIAKFIEQNPQAVFTESK